MSSSVTSISFPRGPLCVVKQLFNQSPVSRFHKQIKRHLFHQEIWQTLSAWISCFPTLCVTSCRQTIKLAYECLAFWYLPFSFVLHSCGLSVVAALGKSVRSSATCWILGSAWPFGERLPASNRRYTIFPTRISCTSWREPSLRGWGNQYWVSILLSYYRFNVNPGLINLGWLIRGVFPQ